jgi:hypothetical protein
VLFIGFAPIEKTGICVTGRFGYSLSYEILAFACALIGVGTVPVLGSLLLALVRSRVWILAVAYAALLLVVAVVFIPATLTLRIPPEKIAECKPVIGTSP